MRISKLALASILVIILFLDSAFLPVNAVQEQANKVASLFPILKSPTGLILSTTPTYSWATMGGVSTYQYQVFQGPTKLVDKYISSTNCGVAMCNKTPDIVLGFMVYKWRVRAKVLDVWLDWSEYKYFTVTPPSFTSDFNGTMTDWMKKGSPNWSLLSTAIITHGGENKYASLYQSSGQYTDFEYTARVKRIFSNGNSCLAFRMGSSIGPVFNDWYPGYLFCLAEDWQFFVLRVDSPTFYTFLYEYHPSSAVKVNDWNVLSAKVVGDTFNFYINNKWMAKVTDDTYKRGFVGFTMYKNTDEFTTFKVDWARLIVILKGSE